MGYWKVNTFFSHNKRMRHTVYHFWLSSNLINCIKYQFRSQVNAIRLLRQSTHDFYFSYLAPQLFSFVERYFLQDHCQLPALQRRKIWVEWIFCVVGSYCISVRTKIRKKILMGIINLAFNLYVCSRLIASQIWIIAILDYDLSIYVSKDS